MAMDSLGSSMDSVRESEAERIRRIEARRLKDITPDGWDEVLDTPAEPPIDLPEGGVRWTTQGRRPRAIDDPSPFREPPAPPAAPSDLQRLYRTAVAKLDSPNGGNRGLADLAEVAAAGSDWTRRVADLALDPPGWLRGVGHAPLRERVVAAAIAAADQRGDHGLGDRVAADWVEVESQRTPRRAPSHLARVLGAGDSSVRARGRAAAEGLLERSAATVTGTGVGRVLHAALQREITTAVETAEMDTGQVGAFAGRAAATQRRSTDLEV
jgi:hypothetical protein